MAAMPSMQATLLQIEEKTRSYDLDVVSPDHFRAKAVETVDAGIILERPNLTLYCLDDERREALFVETPPDADLSRHPFYCQAQYQHAQRLLRVSYETLHELARQPKHQFRNLILIYSVGRCGSTLLSRALGDVDTACSLGEPDVHTQITALRPRDGSRDPELTRLLESCTRLLYKPAGPRVDTLAVKFRSYAIEVGDLMYRAFPQARVLFIYRNAETWLQSYARAFATQAGKDNLAAMLPQNPHFLERTAPLLGQYVRREIRARLTAKDYPVLVALAMAQRIPLARRHMRTPAQYLLGHFRSLSEVKLAMQYWLSAMQRYLDLSQRGIPMLAVRYETLVAAPQAALRAIFEYCGLPLDQVDAAQSAFDEDSQRGSSLAKERVAHPGGARVEDRLSEVGEALAEHPTIRQPDYEVPNTLAV
jgi:hypothetical protein